MDGQVFYLVIISHTLYLALVAGLHIAQYFQVAESCASLVYGAEDHVGLIEGEIDDEGMLRFPFEL